jgi:hypothetical protein
VRVTVVAIWALLGVFALLTFVTYARLPSEELYNVSREGIAGGASRTLVYLNFPVAFVAIGVLVLSLERLRGSLAWLAGLGIALCAVAAIPGVLDQGDLDARWVNAVPAAGVAIAVALSLFVVRDTLSLDPLRIWIAVALAVMSIPWLFAETGFFAPDPIYADEVPIGETLEAVHLGGHHGTYGVLMALAALALSTVARRRVTSALLALLLAYGLVIAVEDFWHEQIDKRGAVDWAFPSLLQPELEWGWLGVLVAAALIEAFWFGRERAAATRRAVPAPAPSLQTP